MIRDCMYIELKTGYSDDGPAWIGYVKTSKTRKTSTLTTNNAFKKASAVIQLSTSKTAMNTGFPGLREKHRHWAGHGKIKIDRRAVAEYLCVD